MDRLRLRLYVLTETILKEKRVDCARFLPKTDKFHRNRADMVDMFLPFLLTLSKISNIIIK